MLLNDIKGYNDVKWWQSNASQIYVWKEMLLIWWKEIIRLNDAR